MISKGMSLYTAQQVKDGEQKVAAELGIALFELMERAGRAVFEQITCLYPQITDLHIFCGGGNNGGDGYVVARLAKAQGYNVTLYAVNDSELIGDAKIAHEQWIGADGVVTRFSSDVNLLTGLVIDALLGTGLKGELRGNYLDAIQLINRSSLDTISVDTPSGLCSDTGKIFQACVKANHTISLIGLKQGLFTGQAAQYSGHVTLGDLGLSSHIQRLISSNCRLLSKQDIDNYLTPRSKTVHKGNNGRVVCLGGDRGMFGAIRLASEACVRVGAGLTRVVTQPENVSALVSARPEVMVFDWRGNSSEINDHLWWADVIALGPGLGRTSWGRSLLGYSRTVEKPIVVDADGLNLLANTPDFNSRRIMTPHPGEAAKLLNITIEEVENNRFNSARTLQLKYGGVVVLKGAGTIIYDGNEFYVCQAGNPGMASGGMGDVLTGVLAGLLAQGLSIAEASKVGVWVHSTAADLCAEEEGERGLLASDLFPYIRRLINNL